MDNNFSNILGIFKKLNETSTIDGQVQDPKKSVWKQTSMSRAYAVDEFGSENVRSGGKNRLGQEIIQVRVPLGEQGVEEGTMASAEQHKTGPNNFTGYWKGTDAGTPGNKMVGASEGVEECNEPMTLADKLRARWAKTKKEQGVDEAFGGNNPGQTPAATTPGAAPAVAPNAPPDMHSPDAQAIKQSLQGLKNKVPSINVDKATQALTKTDADQKLATNDNAAIATGLAPALADIAKNPQLASKLKDLVNQGQKSDLAAQQAAAQQQGGAQ